MLKSLTKPSTLWQLGFLAITVLLVILAVQNVEANLARAGIAVSFGFLESQAGFDISESLIDVSSESSYWEVFLAGILNTIVLSLICIAGATIIGLVMGVLRTSGHYLGVRVAHLYIELMRNLPKLLMTCPNFQGHS